VTERWAKPVIPLGYEEVGRSLTYGGQRWDFRQFILSNDDVERIRLGYVCIHCLEQHERNHPERCSLCGFPIRSIQDEVFEKFYEGDQPVGPSTTLAEEMERAQEIVARGGTE
jgi:hypothetical protein